MEADPGIESLTSLASRLAPMRQLLETKGNVLIVSHSGVYRCLVDRFGYIASAGQTLLGNAEFVTLEQPSNWQFRP